MSDQFDDKTKHTDRGHMPTLFVPHDTYGPLASGDDKRQEHDSWRFVGRFAPRVSRERIQAALKAGRVRRIGGLELLEADAIPELARQSLTLFAGGGVAFALVEWAARVAHGAGPLLPGLGGGAVPLRLAVLVVVNIAAYLVMIPVHEAIHALIILALGGRPRFGFALPWAAFCTAPGQLFERHGYLVVALAPLVVLTVVGLALTWLFPAVGALLWFGFVGNVAGAAGDLTVVQRVRHLAPDALIEDTATGYVAYAVEE